MSSKHMFEWMKDNGRQRDPCLTLGCYQPANHGWYCQEHKRSSEETFNGCNEEGTFVRLKQMREIREHKKDAYGRMNGCSIVTTQQPNSKDVSSSLEPRRVAMLSSELVKDSEPQEANGKSGRVAMTPPGIIGTSKFQLATEERSPSALPARKISTPVSESKKIPTILSAEGGKPQTQPIVKENNTCAFGTYGPLVRRGLHLEAPRIIDHYGEEPVYRTITIWSKDDNISVPINVTICLLVPFPYPNFPLNHLDYWRNFMWTTEVGNCNDYTIWDQNKHTWAFDEYGPVYRNNICLDFKEYGISELAEEVKNGRCFYFYFNVLGFLPTADEIEKLSKLIKDKPRNLEVVIGMSSSPYFRQLAKHCTRNI